MKLCNQYDLVKFGSTVNDIRTKQKISLEKLADLSGISINTIRRLEQGVFSCHFDTFSILSFYLNTDLLELLFHSRDSLYEKASVIRYNLDIDLSKRDYRNLDAYIEQLDNFYEIVIYNTNDPYYIKLFNLIDKMLFWIKGISFSVITKDYEEAEKAYISALQLEHSEFNLLKLTDSKLSGIELNILNSLISNRLESSDFSDIEYLIDNLKEMILKSKDLHQSVYIRLSFNAATLYFHRFEYQKAITMVDDTILYMKINNTKTDYATLVFVKAVSRFQLGLTSDLNEVIVSLDYFVYEDKVDLIPIVLKSLNDVYGIKVNYEPHHVF